MLRKFMSDLVHPINNGPIDFEISKNGEINTEHTSTWFNDFKSNIFELFQIFDQNAASFKIARHDGHAKYKLTIEQQGNVIKSDNLAAIIINGKSEQSAKYASKIYYNAFIGIAEILLDNPNFKNIAAHAYSENWLGRNDTQDQNYKDILKTVKNIKNSVIGKYEELVNRDSSIVIDLTR